MTEADAPARATSRTAYPHLDNLEAVVKIDPGFLSRPVTVTEKIHGFNARAGRDADGTLWLGSRSLAFDADDETVPSLQGFREYARTVLARVRPEVTLYGEWAGKGVQRGIDYGEKRFYLFGVREGDGPVSSTAETLNRYFDLIGVTIVPVIKEGVVELEVLDALRRGTSIVAEGQPIEGVVLAPVEVVRDRHGHQVIAKYKSPTFAEHSSVREERAPVDMSRASGFAAEYVNEERLRHVLDQVAEENAVSPSAKAMVERASHGKMLIVEDPLDVRHTGDVLKAMYEDVVREGQADYEALEDGDKRLVGKAVNKETLRLLVAARDAQLVAHARVIDGQEGP